MKIFDTHEHRGPQVPPDAPGPKGRIDIRHREALYADGERIRDEYVIIGDMDNNDAYLTILRRHRAYLDGDTDLVVDLHEHR
jgi:hypothetical protein